MEDKGKDNLLNLFRDYSKALKSKGQLSNGSGASLSLGVQTSHTALSTDQRPDSTIHFMAVNMLFTVLVTDLGSVFYCREWKESCGG